MIIYGGELVPSGSNVVIPVTGFAVTGSNTFQGNQTVTGSLLVSGSSVLTGSLAVSTDITGSNIRATSNIVGPNITYTTQLSSNGGETRITQNQFKNGSPNTIVWTQTTDSNSTRDIGIRRNTTGSLEIYDGNTADGAIGNRRDLLVRDITGSNATLSGNLTVNGNITAQQFIVSSSVTYLTESFASGSHKFGDSSDDIHTFTGSLVISGSANPLTVGSNLLYVSSSGNVGIGTTSPSYPLEVAGFIKSTGTLIQPNQTEIFPSAGASNRAYAFNVCNIAAGDFTISQGSAATGGTYTTRLVINPSGNVGIGASTAPVYKLEVSTASGSERIRVGTLQNNSNTATFEAITSAGLSTATSGWIRAVYGGGLAIGTSTYTKANGDSGNFANLSSEVQTTAMTVTSGGVVQIHTASGDAQLSLSAAGATAYVRYTNSSADIWGLGNGFASGTDFELYNFSTSVYAFRVKRAGIYATTATSPRSVFIQSDGTLGGISSIRESKTNINQLDSNWLMQLNPVSFNYRKKDSDDKYTNEHYDELFYGLIAEEAELVNKEICTYNDNKLIGIEYSKLIPVLIKSIQELKAEVELLKNK